MREGRIKFSGDGHDSDPLGRIDSMARMIAAAGMKVRKTTEQIFSEAQVCGRNEEIEHLRGCIEAFHREVTELDEKLTKAEDVIDKLRKSEDDLNDQVQGLMSNNERLIAHKESIVGALNAEKERGARRIKTIFRLVKAKNAIAKKIDGLSKKSTKADLLMVIATIEDIVKTASKCDAADKSPAGQSAAG